MTIVHHPHEELLAAYAAGSLDLGQHAAIATHMAMCPGCRAWARTLERVGGAMVAEMAPAPLAQGALERTLARLGERFAPAPAAGAAESGAPPMLPRFLRAYAFGRWRPVAPRIAIRPIRLPEASPTRVFLLKALAGARIIDHNHTGFEMTCVLEGGFSHEGGSFAPGDFEFGDTSTRHEPRVDGDESCLALIAMQGRLAFAGFRGRLIQPFIRI